MGERTKKPKIAVTEEHFKEARACCARQNKNAYNVGYIHYDDIKPDGDLTYWYRIVLIDDETELVWCIPKWDDELPHKQEEEDE